jgi:hypothetical protein
MKPLKNLGIPHPQLGESEFKAGACVVGGAELGVTTRSIPQIERFITRKDFS